MHYLSILEMRSFSGGRKSSDKSFVLVIPYSPIEVRTSTCLQSSTRTKRLGLMLNKRIVRTYRCNDQNFKVCYPHNDKKYDRIQFMVLKIGRFTVNFSCALRTGFGQ